MPGVFRWKGGGFGWGRGVSVYRWVPDQTIPPAVYQVAGSSAMRVEFNTATILCLLTLSEEARGSARRSKFHCGLRGIPSVV